MLPAGLAIEMSVVKSTSGRFKPGLRAPAVLEGGTLERWGRAGAGKCEGAAAGAGEEGGREQSFHLGPPELSCDSQQLCREAQVSRKMKPMTLKECKKEEKADRDFQKKFKVSSNEQLLLALSSPLPPGKGATQRQRGAVLCRDQPIPRSPLSCSPPKHPQIRPVPRTVWLERDLCSPRRESGQSCPAPAPLGRLPGCSAAVCVSVRRKHQRPDSDDGGPRSDGEEGRREEPAAETRRNS